MGIAPEFILINASLPTVVGDASALAVGWGRILAVGTDDDIRALAGPQTHIVDLQGAVVLPGLIDVHNHLLMTGLILQQVQLYDCRSIADIQAKVAAAVAKAGPDAWIIGRGWDESLLSDGRHPNRHDLDLVAPANPVVIHRVWNRLIANTRAITAAGLSAASPDPDPALPYAGGFEREEDGFPAGLFRDRAKDLITNAVPEPTIDELVSAIATGCREYNRLGITAVSEPGLWPNQVRAFQAAAERRLLTVRTAVSIAGWGFGSQAEDARIESRLSDLGISGGFGDDLLWINGVKLMPDGGVGDRTARMFDGYVDAPDNHGAWTVPPEDLVRHIRWSHDNGFAMDIHTCGDEAQEICVTAFADAMTANPQPHLRHRVHHAYFPTEKTLSLMARHQIPAVVSNPFLWSLGESYRLSVGDERVAGMMPMRTYLERGIPLAGSSDSPVASHNPWIGMAAAQDRATVKGTVLGSGECLTAEETLAMYTTGGAYVLNRSGITGTIDEGAFADLIVCDRDPRQLTPAQLHTFAPSATLVAGQWVHGKFL